MADDSGRCSCPKSRPKMDALQFSPDTKQLAINKMELPKVEGHMVIVRTMFAGLCIVDLSVFEGCLQSNNQTDPVTIGHEVGGVVFEVGPDVKEFQVGDKVSVDPAGCCNSCRYCHIGKPQLCPEGGLKGYMGIGRNGFMATYVVADDTTVHKLGACVKPEHGVMIEPLSCVLHALERAAPIELGSKILILGAGIMGCLVGAVLHSEGFRDVTVSEPNSTRRSNFENMSLGFECVNPDIIRDKQRDDPGFLFDCVFECTGSANAVEAAFPLMNSGGTMLILGTSPPGERANFVPFDVFLKELRIVGSLINPYSFAKAVKLVEILGDKYLDFCKLGIKTYDLANYQEAISELKCGGISKAVFKFDLDAKEAK